MGGGHRPKVEIFHEFKAARRCDGFVPTLAATEMMPLRGQGQTSRERSKNALYSWLLRPHPDLVPPPAPSSPNIEHGKL